MKRCPGCGREPDVIEVSGMQVGFCDRCRLRAVYDPDFEPVLGMHDPPGAYQRGAFLGNPHADDDWVKPEDALLWMVVFGHIKSYRDAVWGEGGRSGHVDTLDSPSALQGENDDNEEPPF